METTLSLITKYVGSELELWDFEDIHKGRFFGGLDVGKQNYSAFVVVEEIEGNCFLRYVKVFTPGNQIENRKSDLSGGCIQ